MSKIKITLKPKEIKLQILGRPISSPNTMHTELSGFTPVQVKGPTSTPHNLQVLKFGTNYKKCISIQIQINQPTRCNNFSSLLLDVYVQLNMLRAFSRPSSEA
jgi:hypothetical protein